VRLTIAGTFARVWLVKLAWPQEGDEEKVFALKVLRKVDGTLDLGSASGGWR
jgi:hypothetical protein